MTFIAGLFVGACVALVVFAILTAGRRQDAALRWAAQVNAVMNTLPQEQQDQLDARLRDRLFAIAPSDPPFPPHNPDYPDVNPATGDERETTTGPATDGPWDGPDDDGPVAA